MRNLILIIVFAVMGFLLFRAYSTGQMGSRTPAQGRRPTEVVKGVVASGRHVGQGTAKALDKVDFPGS